MPYIVQVYIYAIIDALRFGTQFKVGQLLDKLKSKFFHEKKYFSEIMDGLLVLKLFQLSIISIQQLQILFKI